MGKTNWGVVLVDLAIIALAIWVSVWQNNPKYLWLLVLMGFAGSLYTKKKDERDSDDL